MPASSILQRIGETVCKDYLHFLPTSNSTKPVHIANGLFRECIGKSWDISDIHKWIVSERRSGDNIASSQSIIDEYCEILTNGQAEDPNQIKSFRYLLEEIFNVDRAAYPSYSPSVLNISSHWLVRDYVRSEATIGSFLYMLLAADVDGKQSPIIELIDNAVSNDTDDITKLIKPILPSGNRKLRAHSQREPFEIVNSQCLREIRSGYDRLADNLVYTKQSNCSLLTLERIVNFSVFVVLYYLINVNRAHFGGNRVPLLLDMGGGLQSVEDASAECFTLSKKIVEEYYVNCIEKILKDEIKENYEECKERISEMPLGDGSDEIRSAIDRFFESFYSEGDRPLVAFARAMQIAIYTFQYKNNTPSDFCRVLGVKCGFVGPSGNAVKKKRLLINQFMLETLVLSILTKDELREGLELKELGGRLSSTYSIVVGANAEADYEMLEAANIAQNTAGNLRGQLAINAKFFGDALTALGLARQYADGVTIVGWRL